MIVIISIVVGALVAGILLTLVSENFADGVSRVVEAALDAVEYRLALSGARARGAGADTDAGETYGRGARAVGV
jgi:hypothetical protein